jgi:hypothetical protein
MKKYQLIIIALCALFLVPSCTLKVPGIKGGILEAKAEKKKVKPVLFEDFEAGTVVGSYSYANTGGNATAEKFIAVNDDKHSGSYSAAASFDTGTDSAWGVGIGFQSAYGGGYIDAKERDTFSAWVKAPAGMSFYFFVNEAQDNGADGEFWNSPNQTGTGKWELYEISTDDFFKNIYSGNQSGNNKLDMTGIGTVGLQFAGAIGKGRVYIDDVWFK